MLSYIAKETTEKRHNLLTGLRKPMQIMHCLDLISSNKGAKI